MSNGYSAVSFSACPCKIYIAQLKKKKKKKHSTLPNSNIAQLNGETLIDNIHLNATHTQSTVLASRWCCCIINQLKQLRVCEWKSN